MPNSLLTIGQITNEALAVLENMLPFSMNANTQYSDQFAKTGAKIGDSISVRVPPTYIGRDGPLLKVESSVETSVPLTLVQAGCDLSFSTADLTLSIDDFSSRFIQPAIASVANKVELNGLLLYRQIANITGTPGTQPTDVTLSNANALLDECAAPFDGLRSVVLSPRAAASIQQATKGLFQSSSNIAEGYKTGRFADGLGFKSYVGQNVWTHTAGPQGGTPVVAATALATAGSTIPVTGWTAAVGLRLRAGDTFTLGTTSNGVLQVNPQSRLSTGLLQSFVVLADFSSDASGNGNLSVFPAIIPSGANQTVDISSASGSLTLTVTTGTANQQTRQSLAFHRDAFTLATADMMLPEGVHMAKRVRSKRSGISLRAIQAYDINTDQAPLRLDILYGWAALRRNLAVRVQG